MAKKADKIKKEEKIIEAPIEEVAAPETPAEAVAAPVQQPEASVENLAAENTIKCGINNTRLLTAVTAVLTVICCVTAIKCGGLSSRVKTLEQNLATMENNLTQNVDNNRKIYVFNMDETVKGIGLQETNQKFETDINDLDAQVKEAQATIKDLKDEVMKQKILNLTIKPLQMKRDDLLNAYSKSMQETLAQINVALAEIATENNVPTIFMSKSVAVNTNYVVDVTEQVVEKIKAKMKQ